ncbi:MAG: translation initiation factor eIF-1A [Candidatus ainarchaeum sp.]|nr:translation initiation factor eIF-1A [Candidatus ainarchaeum sp.]
MKPKGDNNTFNNEEESFERVRLPRRDDLEQFAIITQLMGTDQVKAMCEDEKERQFRIPGKLKKRVWLRENDFIIVKLWDFQPTKGDVIWRYLGNQVSWLKRKGYLNKLPI